MKCVLYSNGCPKCKVLTKKLNEGGINYEVVTDIEKVREKGFMTLPLLEVDGKNMAFGDAIKWVEKSKEE